MPNGRSETVAGWTVNWGCRPKNVGGHRSAERRFYRLRRHLFLGGVKAFLRGFENLNRGRKIVFLEAPRHGLADLVITSRG